MDHFWLTDEQFARIAPHLPTDTRGKARVDARRVISGIVHVLKSGGRWSDAPREHYGPPKTPFNRFVRRAEERHGGVDVLVNNAGYGLVGAVEEVSEAEAREIVDADLLGAL